MRKILTLLHPYCPFVTEELWAHFKTKNADMLMKQSWPKENGSDYHLERIAFQRLIDVITAIRKLRTDQNVEPGKEVAVTLVSSKYCNGLEEQEAHIRRMGKVSSLEISSDPQKLENVASAFLADIEVHLSLEGLVDIEKEKASLSKEKENLEKFIGGLEAKLGNEQFVAKAPPSVVEEQKGKMEEAKAKLQKIEERLRSL